MLQLSNPFKITNNKPIFVTKFDINGCIKNYY